MTDKLGIGRMRELQVAEHLQRLRLITIYWQPPRAKYQDQDVFGLFDLVAVNDLGQIVFIQVKKLYCGQDDLKPGIERFAATFHPVGAQLGIAWYGTSDKDQVNGFPVLKEVRLEYLSPDITWYEVGRWKL